MASAAEKKLKILFLGENWYGSCARACCYALRRQGHEVMDIDGMSIFPQLRILSSRLVLRLFSRRLTKEYNKLVLDTAFSHKPDILIAFKAAQIQAGTLKKLRGKGMRLYNYFPDPSAFAYGKLLPAALPEYDCIFSTKPFWDADVSKQIQQRRSEYLPHGYDPEIHRPPALDERDILEYRHDINVVANYHPHKEMLLDGLISAMPSLDLQIWGPQWKERCRSEKLRKHVRGVTLTGNSYAKALAAARINLAVMSGKLPGASQGDLTTTRTYEIPACGGFMLHERNAEALGFFEEGKEMACYGSVSEIADKIKYYLAHPEERERIALAGYHRCVPAYSYDNRMADLVRWHHKNT